MMRRMLPLAAGPFLVLVFLVSGILLGDQPGGRGATLTAAADDLDRRAGHLQAARKLLIEAGDYLAIAEPSRPESILDDYDPRDRWEPALSRASESEINWERTVDRSGNRYMLTVKMNLTEVHSLFDWIDRQVAPFVIEDWSLTGDGDELSLSMTVLVLKEWNVG